MKRTLLAAVAALLVTAANAAADVAIDENDQTVMVDCAKDPNVSIDGNAATVTLQGNCETVSINGNKAVVTGSSKLVSVNGNDNKLTLVGVDMIAVNGNKNKITYKQTLSARKLKLANTGLKNKIARAK